MKKNEPTFTTLGHMNLNGKEFIISSAIRPCGKIGYYAHELGEITQWGNITGSGERKAHRVNRPMRVKGRHWIPCPFKSRDHAEVMAVIHSEEIIRYF